MGDLFTTGIRPAVDKWLLDKAAEERDYGDYWSASSAGYCMRKVIFERLGVPPVKEDARKQRVFSSGDIFHQWLQEITKASGLSIAQELELQDEELMIRGHIDDLVLVKPELTDEIVTAVVEGVDGGVFPDSAKSHLILYDYKTQNSRAFSYKRPAMSHYHKYQLGTYMYMLRNFTSNAPINNLRDNYNVRDLTEARILKISKDDLRMSEEQLMWTPALEKEVVGYWSTLNGYWKRRQLPNCTCADFEINDRTGKGFMADEKYNPFWFDGEPCSIKWLRKCKEEGLLREV